MTIKSLKHPYYDWLESQIQIDNGRSYSGLFHLLNSREFVWIIPNDDNRVADGLDLRMLFSDESGEAFIPNSDAGQGATVLEVVVALSKRMAFISGGEATVCAWTLLKNLGLDKYPDPLRQSQRREIDELLDALIWRTYEPNGEGGFFPLNDTDTNQTQVELWYQLNSYVEEHPELEIQA